MNLFRLKIQTKVVLATFFIHPLLTACVSLRPEAFKSFETLVATAQKGLESEMARDVEWTREADVDVLAETKNAPLSNYMLKEVKGYVWSTGVTVPHWEARLTLRGLEELNAAFLGYAKLLTQVAQGHATQFEDHEALAAAINQCLRDAETTMGIAKNRSIAFPAGVAAFSSESVIHIQRNGRAKALRAAVQKNQPWVDSYATHCLDLLDMIRTDLKISYANRVESIHARWDDKRAPGRNTLARSIFNLNADYADAMETLQILAAFYGHLPQAHQDLAEGLTHPANPQKALTELASFADQVSRRTQALEKSR